jgi:hypothetical protein
MAISIHADMQKTAVEFSAKLQKILTAIGRHLETEPGKSCNI